MDLSKYLDLISRRKLFFTRVGIFEDKFEGTYTRRHRSSDDEIARIIEFARKKGIAGVEDQSDYVLKAIIRADADACIETIRYLRDYSYVSCWHMNGYESAAMWTLYLKSNEGVAVQTRYGRAKSYVSGGLAGGTFLASQVKYLDYDTTNIDALNFFLPFMCKRKSFEHEKEVRFACVDIQATVKAAKKDSVPLVSGIDMDVNLDSLIEQVFVPPSSPAWFRSVVEDVTRKYGLTVTVRQSDLDSDPVK